MFETLETRRLLSSGPTTAVQTGTLLTVTGIDLNIFEDTQNPGRVVVRDNATGVEQPFTGVATVKFDGSVANNRVFFSGYTVAATLLGGGGTDEIVVDDAGTASSLANGEGSDDIITILHANNTTIIGDGGGDQLYVNPSVADAGPGNQTAYVYGMGGNDVLTVYAGKVFVDGGSGGQDTLIDASNGAAVIVELGGIENHA
jgi:hypothetical protein